MAEALTYDSLLTDVAAYTERQTDSVFVAQIPRFVMLAENRIASECRGLGLLQYVTSVMQPGINTFQKPNRWRETAMIRLNIAGAAGGNYLKLRSYDYCRTFAPDPTVLGQPRYYADYGYEQFFFAQTPDLAYSFELGYFERPQPLDSAHQTSWTTQYSPQILLFATLIEANTFLKNDQKVQYWQSAYDNAKSSLSDEANMRLQDRAGATRSSE